MKLKKMICVCLFIGITIILSGCNIKNNKEIKNDNKSLASNAQQNSDYSNEIQKILNTKVVELDNKNFGELIEYSLNEYSWEESDLYKTKKGTGAVFVKGTDKKTGDEVYIIWGKEMTDPNETNHFIVMSKGREDIIEYELFVNYLKGYIE